MALRRRYATADELVGLITTDTDLDRDVVQKVVAALGDRGASIEMLVKITVDEPLP